MPSRGRQVRRVDRDNACRPATPCRRIEPRCSHRVLGTVFRTSLGMIDNADIDHGVEPDGRLLGHRIVICPTTCCSLWYLQNNQQSLSQRVPVHPGYCIRCSDWWAKKLISGPRIISTPRSISDTVKIEKYRKLTEDLVEVAAPRRLLRRSQFKFFKKPLPEHRTFVKQNVWFMEQFSAKKVLRLRIHLRRLLNAVPLMARAAMRTFKYIDVRWLIIMNVKIKEVFISHQMKHKS